MKQNDEKERNEIIDKLVDVLKGSGVRTKIKNLEACHTDENWFNRDQSEEDYQNEQAAWLKKVAKKREKK